MPGQVTVAAGGHPAVGGRTGSFDAFTTNQTFELVGSVLPPDAITLATVTRVVPPAVNNLADVDAMIAGTKAHELTEGSAFSLDFSDASTGSWPEDQCLAGRLHRQLGS